MNDAGRPFAVRTRGVSPIKSRKLDRGHARADRISLPHCQAVASAVMPRTVEEPAMLSPEELERYARTSCCTSRRTGPGCAQTRACAGRRRRGGARRAALLYLAAAGVGALGVIDDDAVALSNLQRQVIHGTPRDRRG